MAIIRSLAIGKARKSAGNLTFATVEGRTIAREKPVFVKNPRTPAQLEQREKMRNVVAAYRDFGVKVKKGFTVLPKYTSQYNEFVKRNIGVADNFIVDEESGAVSNVIGATVARGSLRFSWGPVLGISASNEIVYQADAASDWTAKIGDMVVFVGVKSDNGEVIISEKVLTQSEVNIFNEGSGIEWRSNFGGTEINAGAAFYYSPSNNTSSNAQISELPDY